MSILNSADQNDQGRWLNCTDITGGINRNPSVLALPQSPKSGGIATNRPLAWGLDFGMLQETLILSGVSGDFENDPSNASIVWLAEAARAGWYGIRPSSTGLVGGVRLYVPVGPNQGGVNVTIGNIGTFTDAQVYQGVIVQFTYIRQSGKLYWDWKLIVQVSRWPANMVSPT